MVIKISTFYDEFGHNNWTIEYSNQKGADITRKFFLEQDGNKTIKLKTFIKTPKKHDTRILKSYRGKIAAQKGLYKKIKDYLNKTHIKIKEPVKIGRTILETPEQIRDYFN